MTSCVPETPCELYQVQEWAEGPQAVYMSNTFSSPAQVEEDAWTEYQHSYKHHSVCTLCLAHLVQLPLPVCSFLLSLSQMKCLQFLRSYNKDKT